MDESEKLNQKEVKAPQEKKSFWKGVLVSVSIMTIMITVVLVFMQKGQLLTVFSQESNGVLSKEVMEKIQILEGSIHENYYKSVEQETLENGLYKGLLSATEDPYSAYYTAEELEEIQEQSQGIYYGIGSFIGMSKETGYPELTKIIEATPAEESGLLAGDFIYKVEGEDVRGLELTEVVKRVKGLEGTTVNLTIIRGTEELEFNVERKKIESPTVFFEMLEDDIAHIEITSFDHVTTEQFREAMEEARKNDMSSLILDLRNNPGGNLDTVNNIARMLLPEGLIVYTEDKHGKRVEYTCDGSQEIDVPLVVLVNGYSASASEVLSGAIKDYGVGTIVGTTTFGKGIVQKIITMNDETALKLTVSNYYTPKGNNIHEIGVEPDVVVEFDGEAYLKDESDNQLNKAIEILSK